MFRVRDGDLDKLGILFQRHHKTLYNFFLALTGTVPASEDLVQEVFLRMLRYRSTYQGKSRFTTWMFCIARNARFDYHRKRQREPVATDVQIEALEASDPVEENYEKHQASELIHASLLRLDEEDREVLLLTRFQNMKYKDLAKIMRCREGTIKARVHRAMGRLRVAFFELSGEST